MQPTPSFGRRGLTTQPAAAPSTQIWAAPPSPPQAYPSYPRLDKARDGLNIGWLLFSTQGRIPRSKYWACKIGLLVLFRVLTSVATGSSHTLKAARAAHTLTPTLLFGALFVILLVLVGLCAGIWSGFAVTVKRWHDRDRAWSWALLGFIPIAGWLWQGIECAFLEGTLGPNRFGPSPKGISGITYQAELADVFS